MNANSKLIIIFLATAMSLVASERLQAQGKPKAGIKGGLNVTNLYIDDVSDENARLGFNLGVYGQIFSTETFAIQTELLYSTKGTEAEYDAPFNETVKFNLNYIDLPVLAVIKLGESAEIHLGGYASYLLKSNVSYTGDVGNGAQDLDRDNFKSYDLGLAGGFGLNFGQSQVGVRYNYGLVKIANSDAARNFIGDSKNSNAQLYVAFNLNK